MVMGRVFSGGGSGGSQTIPSGSSVTLYNTADQTTNYERFAIAWAANVLDMLTTSGGTGTLRALRVGTSTYNATFLASGATGLRLSGSSSSQFLIAHATNDVGLWIAGQTATTATPAVQLSSGSIFVGSSGTQTCTRVVATVNQTGSAGMDILHVNPTLTAVGSGGCNLLRLQAGSTDKLRVTSDGKIVQDATNTGAGTTGAQTINKPTGTVNFAAAATSLVVTNSLVTASSIVMAVVRTADSTAYVKNVVPAAGSFTITLGAAATAETSVGFVVYN